MHVLIVDDDDTLRALLASELARSGYRVSEAATAAKGLTQVEEAGPDVVLLDLMLPDLPGIDVLEQLRAAHPDVEVVVLTAHGTVDTAIAAMKLGAYDYLRKPCHLEELELTLQRAEERRRLGEENARLRSGLAAGAADAELVGCGGAFEELRRLIAKVAASDSTVLVQGETGTGKELVARSIHRSSSRSEAPFVAVDCAALHESLLQSELFGHEKGAFTGATKLKYGLFEAAEGGTLFLDEIGDMSPASQAKLLRVLETSCFRRLGGTREVRVDVRLVAATNRDLTRLTDQGKFRTDLFFRLSTICVDLLPLRKRPEEIPCLANHFVARHNARSSENKLLSSTATEALCAYRWPGNVRELHNVVERALVLADGDLVTPSHLPAELRKNTAASAEDNDDAVALPLAEIERQHVARVLAKTRGHRARCAQILGISERSLYRKLREYRLDELNGAGADDGE